MAGRAICNGNSLAKVKGSLAGHRWSWRQDAESAPGRLEPIPAARGLKLGGINKAVFCLFGFLQTERLMVLTWWFKMDFPGEIAHLACQEFG